MGTLIIIAINLMILLLIMIFLPFMVQLIWRCKPLPESPLKQRLELICKKANFKHAGLKTWTILNHSLTAAIIGVIAPFRYVMFTQRVLNEMSPEMIEAVLVHEIGHYYRRHLIKYPLIIFGVSLLLMLFGIYATPFLNQLWHSIIQIYPWKYWKILYPLFMILPYLAIAALYIRYIFGLFSRLFERQADLHLFVLNTPSQDLIEALSFIGIKTGTTNHPNWHHYSIRQRINFLKSAVDSPQIIKNHHRKVNFILIIYFVLASLLVLKLLFT